MVETRISGTYLVKRLVVSIFVLWALLTLLFLLLKTMPGDITSQLLNPDLGAEEIQRVKEHYGLDDPLWQQYFKWLVNYATLHFGYSLQSPEPVASIIINRLPRTLVLFGTAFLLQYTVGVIAGISFGWNRGSAVEQTGFITGLTLYSIPAFWIAWMLLLVLAHESFGVAWLPTAHMTTPFVSVFTAPDLMFDVLFHLLIPAGSLVVLGWAGPMLVMRTSMQEVVDAPHIETARAKGLSPAAVKYKHAARNALIPVATQAMVGIAFVIDGAVIVEAVFSWPGMGKLLIEAIQGRDLPVALAAFFGLGVIVVVMRFLTDIAYTYLDPRIKFGESE